jgi:D-alanyl-D-alanine carboxypeptidase
VKRSAFTRTDHESVNFPKALCVPRGMKTLKVLALAFVVAIPCVHAQTSLQPIPVIAKEYAKAHNFSGTLLVARNGTVLDRESFGLANQPFAVQNSPDTRYRVASITKAFTAVLTLQLVQEGKLRLSDTVTTYLPDFSGEGGNAITLHDLLHHTSGLPNPDRATRTYEEALQKGLPQYEAPQTPSSFVKRFCTGKLTNPVGSAFDYNNCDFIVLGEIISRITGMSYEQALKTKLLSPLHMESSGLAHEADILPRLANTYFRPGASQPLRSDFAMYPENMSAAGAMYSTVDDLSVFGSALFSGQLLDEKSLDEMMTPGLDNYGDGIWVQRYEIAGRKRRAFERYGTSMGANALLTIFPEDGLAIILLSNTNETDLGEFRLAIARAAIQK